MKALLFLLSELCLACTLSLSLQPRLTFQSKINLSSSQKLVENASNEKSQRNFFQSVDFTTLSLVAEEMKASIVPSKVENVFQIDSHNLAISIKGNESSHWLRICWQSQKARIHIGSAPPLGKEDENYSFSSQLRKFLKGSKLVEVSTVSSFERVCALSFAERLSEPPTHKLFVEVMGSRSNVILTSNSENENLVLCCAYQVSPSKSKRPIGFGYAYVLPPPMAARSPDLSESFETFYEYVARNPSVTFKKALVNCYKGVSPVLVENMALSVKGLDPGEIIGKIENTAIEEFHRDPWKKWLKVITEPNKCYENERSNFLVPFILEMERSYYPLNFSTEQIKNKFEGTNALSKMLSAYYDTKQDQENFSELQKRCFLRVQSVLTRLNTRIDSYNQRLLSSSEEEVKKLNEKGDLLTTYHTNWKNGENFVRCMDFITNNEVKVPLEIKSPKNNNSKDVSYLNPLQTAQSMYRAAKKLKRGVAHVEKIIEETKIQLGYAESIELSLQFLDPNTDRNILKEIAEELGIGSSKGQNRQFVRLFGTKQVQKGKKIPKGGNKREKQASLKGLLQLKSPTDSVVVLIGRNNLQNDKISFQLAKSHEVWMHARGVPGSHVLMRFEPGENVSECDLQFAANLAAFYSKARNSAKVPIDVVSPKNLKRVSGAGPGMVQFVKSTVMWGDPRNVAENSVPEKKS